MTLQAQGVKGSYLLEVAKNLSKLQKGSDSRFRNVYHVKTLLHTMYTFATNNAYPPEQKLCGFEKFSSTKLAAQMQ